MMSLADCLDLALRILRNRHGVFEFTYLLSTTPIFIAIFSLRSNMQLIYSVGTATTNDCELPLDYSRRVKTHISLEQDPDRD